MSTKTPARVSDEDIDTTFSTRGAVAQADADGTDGDATDATDGDAGDGDATDVSDGDATDADGHDA